LRFILCYDALHLFYPQPDDWFPDDEDSTILIHYPRPKLNNFKLQPNQTSKADRLQVSLNNYKIKAFEPEVVDCSPVVSQPKCALLMLPAEVQLNIVRLVPLKDKISLASACRSFCYIFKHKELERSRMAKAWKIQEEEELLVDLYPLVDAFYQFAIEKEDFFGK